MLMKETTLQAIEPLVANKLEVERLLGDTMGVFLIGGIKDGKGISQYSQSPPLWNKVFAELGMNAHYQALDIETPTTVEAVLSLLAKDSLYMGNNVGMPYKTTVMNYLRQHGRLDQSAIDADGVNTVVHKNGVLVGYSTDGRGEMENLRSAITDFKGLRVLLIGAGGGAKAVAAALVVNGIGSITIANRTQEHAEELVRHLQKLNYYPTILVKAEADVPQLVGSGQYDLILNATSKGQATKVEAPYSALALTTIDLEDNLQSSRIAFEDLIKKRPNTVIADLIYAQTPMLKQAKEVGFTKVVDGRGMLVWQAVFAFELIFRDWLVVNGVSRDKVAQPMFQALP